ncbi:hypothetical protein M378DRAFT_160538 [Amanita muscaria Koide BX008]|uniref:Calcineurin-like phosphoesterase domain-containing protein n=1 Tax=Amanita muscaria (strain Koide BX008) TaxID=946122 RepID=A0A0C2WXN1_AMAMK|nr:hypothetical protein M378DRAFT_160538 [Amanita muscaria Koide BX008]
MGLSKVLKSQHPLSEQTDAPISIHTADAIVHLEYECGQEPPKPPSEDRWTRFVCISDTHCEECPVPDGDVLLHSGDLTHTGGLREVKETMAWLYSLPHQVKIIIAGNHDLTFHHGWYEKTWKRWHGDKQDQAAIMELVKGPAAKEAGIVYLDCEEYQFSLKDSGKVWTVYGSPWQPEFGACAFNYSRSKAHTIVDRIPKVDILLTHGPPYGVLDETSRRLKVGCKTLSSRLPQLQPRLHTFGHIHESHGAYIHSWDKTSPSCPVVQSYGKILKTLTNPDGEERRANKTVFVNASNLPTASQWNPSAHRLPFAGPGFQPVVVDLKDNTGN